MLTNAEFASGARQAADLIRTHGWFKESGNQTILFPVSKEKKCFCVVTALPVRDGIVAVDAFAKYLGWRLRSGVSQAEYVMGWNDLQSDAEAVITMLEQFANFIEKEKEPYLARK